MAVKLEVIPEGDTKLFIRHEPSFARSYIMALLALWGAGFYFFFPSTACLQILVVAFLLALFSALAARELETVIDKTSGQVIHKRGGWLGSKLGAKVVHYSLSELKALEIQRHIRRYSDGFQITFLLVSGNRVELSTKDLGFKEVHEFANRIHQLLGPVIALEFVEWKMGLT